MHRPKIHSTYNVRGPQIPLPNGTVAQPHADAISKTKETIQHLARASGFSEPPHHTLCEVVQRAKPDPVWVKLPWLLEDLTPPEVAGLKPQACSPNDSPLLVVMRSMGKTTMGNHWMVRRPLPSCMSVDSISKPTRSQQRTSGGNGQSFDSFRGYATGAAPAQLRTLFGLEKTATYSVRLYGEEEA